MGSISSSASLFINDFEKSNKDRLNLTADDIEAKTIENIRKYLGHQKYYAEMVFDFYTDSSQTVEDLDKKLRNILATKYVNEELFVYIIKEVIILNNIDRCIIFLALHNLNQICIMTNLISSIQKGATQKASCALI